MTGDFITIGAEELKDQRERMVEEWDVTEDRAEEIFTDVKTQVSLTAQEMGKQWDNETLEAVTNLVMAIQFQNQQTKLMRQSHFHNRVYNLIAAMVLGGLAGLLGMLVTMGNVVGAGIVMGMLTFVIYMHVRNA